MTPTNFEEQELFLWPAARCIRRRVWAHCHASEVTSLERIGPLIISAWKPTAEELAEINKTGVVWLRIYSTGMSPVSLSGHSPFVKASDKPEGL